MKRCCPHCPFRTDIPGFLHPARAGDIGRSLLMGAEFPCHETVTHDEDGEGIVDQTSQHCAGALIFQTANGIPDNGWFDSTALDTTVPVAQTLGALIRHHRSEYTDRNRRPE